MSTKNYMDYFNSPKDFIKWQVTSNKGKRNAIYKDSLIEIAQSNGIKVSQNMKKSEIYDLICEHISLEEFVKACGNLGVHSNSFQQKFNINHQDVKRMARLGFIHITGTEHIRLYGKHCDIDLYSVFDYFRLTKEAVRKWLDKNPKCSRKTNSVSS